MLIISGYKVQNYYKWIFSQMFQGVCLYSKHLILRTPLPNGCFLLLQTLCWTDCVKTFEWRVLPEGNFTYVTYRTHLFCTLYWLIFFIVIDTYVVLWIFLLIDIYLLSWNWSLWRKTSTVVYCEMWLNRVIVHWIFLFDNLILYWVMFELLLFL